MAAESRDDLKKRATYIQDRLETYFGSKCYKTLASRHSRLQDAYDLRYHTSSSNNRATNTWKSKVVVPLAREAMVARRAVTLANFRNDPLITLLPTGKTGYKNAQNLQDTITSNFRKERFRERAFNDAIVFASKYGSSIVCANYVYETESMFKTQPIEIAGERLGYERAKIDKNIEGVRNKHIHFLNYFQNPFVRNPYDSDYRGYVDSMTLAEFMAMVQDNPEAYIKSEVDAVVNEAKKGGNKNSFHHEDIPNDYAGIAIDIVYWYGTQAIKGKEDDGTVYYDQMVGNHIVRHQENPNDENVVPITCLSFDQRDEYWWGNCDGENVMPMENYLQMSLAMAADSGLRALQNWIFYDKNLGFNPSTLQNQAKSGGFVPLELKNGQQPKDLFFMAQGMQPNTQSMEYISREVKEAAQRASSRKDFSRGAQSGGPQNDTATAAMMMDQDGDTQEAYLLTQFAYGVGEIGRINGILLQEYTPEEFSIRPQPKEAARRLEKGDILGDFDYYVKTSLTNNNMVKANKLLNAITAIQNFKGAGVDQSWMNVQLAPIIKGWINQLDLEADFEEIMPNVPAGPAGGATVQNPGIPGQPMGAPPLGLPAPQPTPAPAEANPLAAMMPQAQP